MAILKFGHAAVATPVVCPGKWVDKKSEPGRVKVAKQVIAKYDPSQYLLSHCFPAGHMVLMADGTEKLIEDVSIGDLVVTHKGNIRPVTDVISREVSEDLVEVKASSLPKVLCTKEHPFYIIPKENAWCKIFPSYDGKKKCIYGYGKICSNYKCSTNGYAPEWRIADKLIVGDRTYTPTLHEILISDDLNPNRMRLLGYYVAEGRCDTANWGSRKPYMVRFSIHEDEQKTIGKEISRLMKIEFGIKTHSVIKKKDCSGVTLSYHNFGVAEWFLKHAGIGSHTKKLSMEVVLAPLSWQKLFIGAWLNGDGHYDIFSYVSGSAHGSKSIRLSTVSDHLKSQAVTILDRLEIHTNVQKCKKSESICRGKVIESSECWHIVIPKSFVTKLSSVVKWKLSKNSYKCISTKQRYRYAASTISSVLSVGRKFFSGKVYNLSVKDDESYIVNRQAVHNCSIMASVDTDYADINDKKSNYLIKPEHSIFVNNNGDSWERDLLKKASKTFIGSDNFIEHVQIDSLSKGKVIDVALRDVPFAKDSEGKDLTTLYVDILIATNRKHKDIIEKIMSGEYNSLSMGCLIKYSQCSQCGRIMEDESQACKHVRYFKHNHFYDSNGIKRIIAELCGRAEEPDSCKFIDASWVRKPAFEGAVLRNILDTSGCSEDGAVGEKLQKAISFPSFEYAPGMFLKAASSAARSVVNELEAQDAPAPAAPKDDAGFPPAPSDTEKPLDLDTPPAEEKETPPADDAALPPVDAPADPAAPASLGDKMGDPGAAPEPQIDEPKEDATVSEVKDMVKKQLLNQIRRELLKEQAKEQSADRPIEMENVSNSSLVKQASLQKIIKTSKSTGNDRLYNGLMILANLKDWKQFKKYGYNRDDVLAILYYIDKNASSTPVGKDAVVALSKIRFGSEGLVPFFTEFIVETGRKPQKIEARKIAAWGKILSYFE